MSPSSRRPPHFPIFQFRLLTLCLVLCGLPALAQQPNVPAPHNPVSPRLPDSPPPASDMTPRYLRGGLWMTDAFTTSAIYVRNDLETSSLPVTPVLYLSNGTPLLLPPVVLQPNASAVISINDALASQGISPYATLSGYV